jgi:hypothetical protein
MTKNTKKVEVTEVVEKTAKAVKSEVTVVYRGGTRTYSKEVHGENFAELAQEFAEKKGGTIA